MKTGKLLASLLLLVAPMAVAQDKGADACYRLLEEGKANEALAVAVQMLDADKNNREALLCQGRAHAELKQYDESLSALKAAEKLSTGTADQVIALLLMGNVQKDAGNQADSLASYQQALKIATERQDKTLQRLAMNILGDAQVESGLVQQGLEHYLQAADLAANDGERGENFTKIAAAYAKLGNSDQAVEYQVKTMLMLERVGERDEYANAGLELGKLYMDAGNYTQAENAINKVLKFAVDNDSAYWQARSGYYLGLAKAGQGQAEAARALMLDAHHKARQIGATSLAGEIGNAMLKLPDR